MKDTISINLRALDKRQRNNLAKILAQAVDMVEDEDNQLAFEDLNRFRYVEDDLGKGDGGPTITLFKDNKIDGEHEVEIKQLVKEFFAKPDEVKAYENGVPFERLFLTHLMDYGSFDGISDAQWSEVHKERKLIREATNV